MTSNIYFWMIPNQKNDPSYIGMQIKIKEYKFLNKMIILPWNFVCMKYGKNVKISLEGPRLTQPLFGIDFKTQIKNTNYNVYNLILLFSAHKSHKDIVSIF